MHKSSKSKSSWAVLTFFSPLYSSGRRDFILTKAAIKNQLELVDKHRVLWKNSSQEVNRLKALLLAAEETEQQHRTQLTNSQLQTQKLKMKMQSVEKVISVLQGSIAVNRYSFPLTVLYFKFFL